MKYKLVKEYPGSIKLGTIVYLETEDNYMTNMENDFKLFPKKIVENYPEFWEEVVEKDYEILSYIHNGSKHIWKKDSQLKDTFCLEDGKSPFTRLEDILKHPKIYLIHSVKRKDGEIFTIGDKIFPNNKIYKFELKNDILKIWHCDISFSTPIIEGPSGQPGNCSWIEGINNIKKIKQPLFTTEDDIDIFEGNKYYYMNSNFSDPWKIVYTRADCPSIIDKNNLNYKRFSTKEKAEEYILYNKPLLTLKDIEELLCKNTSSYFLEKFKKRAQKLNNKN